MTKGYTGYTGRHFRMWPLTVLTGVRVNGALGGNVWAFRREKN